MTRNRCANCRNLVKIYVNKITYLESVAVRCRRVKKLFTPTHLKENNSYESTIPFNVTKRWYQTHIAYFFFLTLLIIAVYIIVLLRVQYLKKAKDELEKEVQQRTVQLNENITTLNETKSNLIAAVQTKNNLLGIISHEIVGGINSIRNISELGLEIQEDNSKTGEGEFFKDIHKTAEHTSKILSDILLWVKTQNKDIQSSEESVHIHETVQVIQNQLATFSKQKNVTITNEIDKSKIYKTDKASLLLILHSLIENEIKYNEKTEIHISSHENSEFFMIQIHNKDDKGTMDVESANHFFLNDNQENISSSILLKGLGFFIVKDLLKNINGHIEFKREKSNQHTIYIKFSRE